MTTILIEYQSLQKLSLCHKLHEFPLQIPSSTMHAKLYSSLKFCIIVGVTQPLIVSFCTTKKNESEIHYNLTIKLINYARIENQTSALRVHKQQCMKFNNFNNCKGPFKLTVDFCATLLFLYRCTNHSLKVKIKNASLCCL